MADNSVNLKVETGPFLHGAIVSFAQHVFSEYGIKIKQVSIDWMEIGSIGKQTHKIESTHIVTEMAE